MFIKFLFVNRISRVVCLIAVHATSFWSKMWECTFGWPLRCTWRTESHLDFCRHIGLRHVFVCGIHRYECIYVAGAVRGTSESGEHPKTHLKVVYCSTILCFHTYSMWYRGYRTHVPVLALTDGLSVDPFLMYSSQYKHMFPIPFNRNAGTIYIYKREARWQNFESTSLAVCGFLGHILSFVESWKSFYRKSRKVIPVYPRNTWTHLKIRFTFTIKKSCISLKRQVIWIPIYV